MGIDIHLYTEKKTEHGWKCADYFELSYKDGEEYYSVVPLWEERDIELFSLLGGVYRENENITPIMYARGFPKDVSSKVRREDKEYNSFGRSYFTVEELLEWLDNYKDMREKFNEEMQSAYKKLEFLVNKILDRMRAIYYVDEYGINVSSAIKYVKNKGNAFRIVFFFDR